MFETAATTARKASRSMHPWSMNGLNREFQIDAMYRQDSIVNYRLFGNKQPAGGGLHVPDVLPP